MVESSIGISAMPLIAEESIMDPIVGAITGLGYGAYKVYDKIRGRNNDDFSIDVLTNEEQKEPTREDMMSSWRDIRSRDARHRRPVQPMPHQLPPDDDLEVPQENYGGQHDIIPQTNEPTQVIQEQQTRDHLDLVPVDVQIPLEEEKQPQPQFVDNEQEFENRQFGNGDGGNNNDPDPDPNNNNGGNGGGNDPDPNPNGNNQQPEEQKNNRGGIQDSPLFNNAINQIINQIDSLKKQKNDEQNKDMTDAERQRYISDIEVQIRSQQQLIDLLTKFGQNQIDVNKLNDELDQIQQSMQAQKIQQFTEDYVFSDIVQTF